MSEEKLWTVRDVSIYLGVSEKEVVDLAESGSIPAYKVGGVYLRFKKEQIQDYKKSSNSLSSKVNAAQEDSLDDRVSDFLYFNDFYIFTILLIILLLVIIFRGY